jgi:ABC-type thiamin/hydroxymethylpyrimidine transport system permease subunit
MNPYYDIDFDYDYEPEPAPRRYSLLTTILAEILFAIYSYPVDFIIVIGFTAIWCLLLAIVSLVVLGDLLCMLMVWESWERNAAKPVYGRSR